MKKKINSADITKDWAKGGNWRCVIRLLLFILFLSFSPQKIYDI